MNPASERITLRMSATEMMAALSEADPRVIGVLAEMSKASTSVDPDAAMGAFAPLQLLNAFGVRGPRIWQLYSDVCGEDVTMALAWLRAVQLGILNAGDLDRAIDGPGNGIVNREVLEAVQQRLPRFAAAALSAGGGR